MATTRKKSSDKTIQKETLAAGVDTTTAVQHEVPKLFTATWRRLMEHATMASTDGKVIDWLGKEIEAMGNETVTNQKINFKELGPIGESQVALFFRDEPADAEIRSENNRFRLIVRSDRVEDGNGDRRSMEIFWDHEGKPQWLRIRQERVTSSPEGTTVVVRTLIRNHLSSPDARGGISDVKELYTQTPDTEPFILAGPHFIPVKALPQPPAEGEKVYDLPVWTHQYVGVSTGGRDGGTFEVRTERRIYGPGKSPKEFVFETPLEYSGPDYATAMPTWEFLNGGQPHDWVHENPVIGQVLSLIPVEDSLLHAEEAPVEEASADEHTEAAQVS